jgi:DeoR/GlpR family transcriptional regulator of sugar metabolism
VKSADRRSYLIHSLDQQGSVTVTDASKDLNVSPMTIRRDLLELERAGLARRVHGGAVPSRGRSYEPPLQQRGQHNAAAKTAIARVVAGLIADGDSLALDTGSTCLRVAQELRGRDSLMIVTASTRIANEFGDESAPRVLVTGGYLRHGEMSLTGELAAHTFSQVSVDKLVLAAAGVHAEFGLSDFNLDDVAVKRAMIRSAKDVIVVADSAKFDQIAFARIAGLEIIRTIVTDAVPGEELSEQFARLGTRVIVAEPGQSGLVTKTRGATA